MRGSYVPASHSGKSAPALRLFGAEPVARNEITLEIRRPGTYTLLLWSLAEWDRLDPRDRPRPAWRKGGTWFSFFAADLEGDER